MMSARVLALIGLVSLPLSLALMYLLFVDVYALEAGRAAARFQGQPEPVTFASFVSPASLPPGRLFLLAVSGFFASLVAASLLILAQKAHRMERTATPTGTETLS
jgi:hypothetical protein